MRAHTRRQRDRRMCVCKVALVVTSEFMDGDETNQYGIMAPFPLHLQLYWEVGMEEGPENKANMRW